VKIVPAVLGEAGDANEIGDSARGGALHVRVLEEHHELHRLGDQCAL
jgi:hypothetical protein